MCQSTTIEVINKTAHRGGFGRGRSEASCFWCVQKGHTLIDCTGPASNSDSKLAHDQMIAARAQRDRDTRNTDRKERRLQSATTSVGVSDDEIDDGAYSEAYSEASYEEIQTLFGQLTEPTKK